VEMIKQGLGWLREFFSFFCCICWVRFQLYLSIYRDNNPSRVFFSNLLWIPQKVKLVYQYM
jgi:hypothetical protein